MTVMFNASMAVVFNATMTVVFSAAMTVVFNASMTVVFSAVMTVVFNATMTVVFSAVMTVVFNATMTVVFNATMTVVFNATMTVVFSATMTVVFNSTMTMMFNATMTMVFSAAKTIQSKQFRDNLYKKQKMTDPLSVGFGRLKINLNTYNKILKNSIRLAKKNYYENIFAKFKNDTRATWKTINEILNRTKRQKSFPCFFKDGNNIISNKMNIANKFNSFFINVGKNLNNAINMPHNKSFNDYL